MHRSIGCFRESYQDTIQILKRRATPWIIFFDSGLNGLYAWFCRGSCWRTCRFGWFSIFWINCRTLVLCASFTMECGSPGILKSMSSPFFHDVSHRQCWSSSLMIHLRVVLNCNCFFTCSPWSVMSLLNIKTLAVFRWMCLNFLCFNWSPCFIWRNLIFVKRFNIDLLRTGSFSSILQGFLHHPW